MKLKKVFKSNPKKTYLTNERTYKVKEKVKKFKKILEKEAKNTIEEGRRESIYIPLENNMTVESPVTKKASPSVKKKPRRKIPPIEKKSDDTFEVEYDECGIDPAESKVEKKKKKKKKRKGKYEDSEDGKEPTQSMKKSQKKKIVQSTDATDDNLNTSVNEPLISEPESSRDLRTIYIGNLPVDFKKKKLLKVLKAYGNVEKMWTRGAKPLSALPKKIALIKGKLHENHPPLMVHAVFRSVAEAHSALKLNGELYDGNRLRVTMSQEKIFDSRKGVFVGNLPFEIEDDDLFNLFQQCGEIINVRIVRDGKTGAGKGFGYVNFKSIDSVELALNLNEEKFNGREIRVQRLFSPGKKKKMDKKKGKQLLKASLQTKEPRSAKKNKSVSATEKQQKKKNNKMKLIDLKKKIMAKKLSIKSKKSAD